MLEAIEEYKQLIATWAMVIGLSMFGGLADAIMRYRRDGGSYAVTVFFNENLL